MYENLCFTIVPYRLYDGTNAAEIRDAAEDPMGTWTYNEVAGVLTIIKTYAELDPNNMPYVDEWSGSVGEYFIIGNNGGMVQVLTPEVFNQNYAPVLESVNEPVLNSTGVSNIPTLAANASATVVVELKPAMDDVNFTVVAQVIGNLSLLGNLEVQSTTITNVGEISVVVKNKNLLSTLSGARVLVQAVSN